MPQPDRLLTTPHRAAVAGIISGVLLFVSQWLLNLAVDDIQAGNSSLADRKSRRMRVSGQDRGESVFGDAIGRDKALRSETRAAERRQSPLVG